MLAPSALPDVAPPRWLTLDADDSAVLRAVLALPPPPRAIDAGDAGVLRTITLVRAWASSRAALQQMIDRRRSVAVAIGQSAADGAWPARRELGAWFAGDGATQLGFASVLAASAIEGNARDGLRRMADADVAALGRIDREMQASLDADEARVASLRALRHSLPARRILAFSELASTVRAYWRGLRSDPAVGMLTSHEARIASGRVTRADLLDRFAPVARGAPSPHRREAVTLLLTTDLLSEGVNLQDASVVVHLDLPWNPARLAQRIGRVRRLGGASEVLSFLVRPPASTELLLGVEARLRAKLADAEQAIGRSLPVLPSLTQAPGTDDPTRRLATSADALGEMYSRVAAWRRASWERDERRPPRPIVAAVAASRHGWLAAFDDGRLLASLDGAPPDDAASAIVAVRLADGPARPLRCGEADAAQQTLTRWFEARRVERQCGLDSSADGVRHECERRIALDVASAARYERSSMLATAQRLRGLLQRPRSLGADRALLALLRAPVRASAASEWMRSAIALLASPRGAHPATDDGRLVALLVFGPL
jgi:hypothetical protein